MEILQVKQYHNKIAYPKYRKAIDERRFNPKSMYFFFKVDLKGFPTEERKNGYICFDETKACFGMTREKAINYFKK